MNNKNGKLLKCLECSIEFYVPKCQENRKFCSMKCSQKASKVSRLGINNPYWKGENGNFAYTNLHKFIRKNYGKALDCENELCTKNSPNFGWANLSGIYERDVKHFVKLCKSCHINFDRYKKPIIIKGKMVHKKITKIMFKDYQN